MQSVNFNTLVLGYQHYTSPNWFKQISSNEDYVQNMCYTDSGFKFALIASKNKKNIRDIDALNTLLISNGMPVRI